MTTILNKRGIEMKKLTQAIFDGAPDWVMSAAIQADGSATLHDVTKDKLKPWLDVPFPMMIGGRQSMDVGDGYDATNWQNSAIDREVSV